MTSEQIIAKYGRSEQGNFGCIDTIGVPHSYVIGPKHVVHASDHFSGRLGEEAIKDAEKKGVTGCQWQNRQLQRCSLPFAEHKRALLVECLADMRDPGDPEKMNAELHAYLLKHKEASIADNFEGFAFLDKRPKEPSK